MHELFKLIDEHNAVALVTNQVMSNPAVFFGDPTKPIGGNIVGHTATFRLYLRKSKGGKRIARLVDRPNLPEGDSTIHGRRGGTQIVLKALLTDIEGTITDSSRRLNTDAIIAIRSLVDNGIEVVLASGRPEEGIFQGVCRLWFE